MNTKKAVWINKPEIRKITLHTIEYESRTSHSVFFVLGENESITLDIAGNAAFALLHTPEDYVILKEDETIVSFKGVRSSFASGPGRHLEVRKEGDLISFASGGFSLSVRNPAFRDSASAGVTSEGEGIVSLDVF